MSANVLMDIFNVGKIEEATNDVGLQKQPCRDGPT